MIPLRSHTARILLAASALLAAAPSVRAAVHFTPLGPNGGAAFAVVPAPSAPQVLYAATAGGVFKSLDGARSWTGLDRTIGRRDVRALAIDPRDADVVYAGTESANVYKSTDGGTTWRFSGNGLASAAIRALAIDPRSPDVLYAGTARTTERGLPTGGGIFRSDDGGSTWRNISVGILTSVDITGVAVDPASSATLYAVGTWIYKSLDGGNHWSKLPASPIATQVLLDPARPGTLFASCVPTPLFIESCPLSRSTDGGVTWRAITPAAASPEAAGDLPLAIGAGGVLYTRGFKSHDAGSTWVPTVRLAALAMGLAADPFSPGTLYAATLERGVYRSADDAASWQAASRGLRATSISAVAVDPARGAVVFTGIRRVGLLRGRPLASTWRPLHPWAPAFVAVDPAHPQTLYAPVPDVNGGDDLLTSADGGATFRTLDVEASFSYCLVLTTLALDPADPRTLYVGGYGGENRCDAMGTFGFKSTDGGGTWTTMPGVHDPVTILVDPRRPSTLYALDPDQGVRKSRDAGASWADASPVPRQFFSTSLALDPTAPQVLYLDTDSGLYATADGGSRWRFVDRSLSSASVLLVDPRSPQTLYAGITADYLQPEDVARAGIYRSTDRGRTWTQLDLGVLGARFSGALALDPRRANSLYVGTDGAGLFQVTIDAKGR